MNAPRERDQAIERLLRQSLRAAPETEATASCLDAETLAAWADGGLSGAPLEMAQSHAAGCVRCLALIETMARVNEPVAAAAVLSPRRWLMWLVPLTAAAAAVAVWVAIPARNSGPITQVARVELPEQTAAAPQPVAPSRGSVPEERRLQSAAVPAPRARALQAPAPPQPANKEESRASAETAGNNVSADAIAGGRSPAAEGAPAANQRADTAQTLAAPQPFAAAAGAPPAPAAAPAAIQAAPVGAPVAPAAPVAPLARAQRAFVAAPIEIVSSDPGVRWRINGQTVERSTDSGASWQPAAAAATAALTAGVAPSPTVCWLVGRGGLVLLTTDGRTWRRVPFPSPADVTAVQSTDPAGRSATVVTADGQTFATTDAGALWIRR